jgi:ubiquinone/menaquinone biosynthesis C-methylase UbiE
MTDRKSDAPPVVESWDTYWDRTAYGAAYTSEGVSHPAIQSFWDDFFRTVRTQYDAPKIIDIASGNGAVVECAESGFGGQLPDFTCLDVSASAIRILEQRFPAVHTIVADACQIPLDSAGYDIATSQFGIEYAGLEAIDEVARLIAPGGQLALLLHNKAGSIYKECAASLDAIEKMQEARFIPYAIAMFEKGFAACSGADRADYEAAAKQLAPAVRALESIMMQHGKHVAGDTVMRLYDDVGKMHEHIQHYEPSDVLDWLNRLEGELQAFAGRMTSMCGAAIDSNTFDRLCEALRSQAFTTVRAEALAEPDQQLPLAWALIAIRD